MILKTLRTEHGKISPPAIAAIVLIFLFLLFLVQNSATVDISFLFWKLTMSRVILLFGSLAIGVIIGFLAGWEIFGKKAKG